MLLPDITELLPHFRIVFTDTLMKHLFVLIPFGNRNINLLSILCSIHYTLPSDDGVMQDLIKKHMGYLYLMVI